MFWTPQGPFISNRPVRVVNLGRAWLGQDPNNRLLSVPVAAILRRWKLATPAAATYPDLQPLIPVSQSPTSSEAEDLSLIDWFFLYKPLAGPATDRLERDRMLARDYGVAADDPFYYPKEFKSDVPTKKIPFVSDIGAAAYFDIQTSGPWGNIKPSVKNAAVMLEEISKYPLPSAISANPSPWYQTAQPDLAALVKAGKPLDPEGTRTWITLNVLKYLAAQQSQTTAEAFEASADAADKAFANEIRRVAAQTQSQAAQAQPSGAAPGAPGTGGIPTGLLVGGGIAAAAGVVFAILR